MKIGKTVLFIFGLLLLMPIFLAAEGKKEEAVAEMEPLTFLVDGTAGGREHFADSLMYQEWQKRSGVKIQLQFLGGSAEEQISTMLASGDMPDMMQCPKNIADEYGPQGAFIKFNEHFNKIPNIKKHWAIDKNPYVWSPDQNLYAVIANEWPYLQWAWLWRKDWADRLGIEKPKTVDDWVQAWRKVKQDDPESIPWIGGSMGSLNQFLCPAFGIGGCASAKYTFRNGELSYPWVDERAKELITLYRDMYREGIIWKEFLTGNWEMYKAQIAKGNCFCMTRYAIGAFDQPVPQEVQDNIEPVPPPKGPYGDSGGCDWMGPSAWWAFTIPASTSNLDAALRFYDYWFSEEGMRTYIWGVEGITYEVAKDGIFKYTDKVKKEAETEGIDLETHLAKKYNLYLYGTGPGPHFDAMAQIMRLKAVGADKGYLQAQATAALYLAPINPPIWNIREEMKRMNSLYANRNTFESEWLTKFIVGEEPLTKWDWFVEEIKKLGIGEVEDLANRGYERYLKTAGKQKGYMPDIKTDTTGIKKLVGLE